MTDVTTLLAPVKARALAAAKAEVTFNGDSLDQDYIRALEASHEDVPRLVAALEAVAGLHKPRQFDPLKDGVWFGQSDFDYAVCDHCVMTRYPCPTITAVVAALGGGE